MKAFSFLSRQFCFIFLLMFSLAQVGWGAAGAGAPAGGGVGAAAGVVGDDSPGPLTRIAAIQILPYDPLREDCGADYHVDKYEIPEGYSPRHGEYRDHFGFGRNCDYYVPEATDFESRKSRKEREAREVAPVPAGAGTAVGGGGAGASAGDTAAPPVPDAAHHFCFGGPCLDLEFAEKPPAATPPDNTHYASGTHGYYLEHLARYKENLKGLKSESGSSFANGNYLLVRVDVLIPGPFEPKRYIFGTFSSGAAELFNTFDLKNHLEPKPLIHLIKEGSFPAAKGWLSDISRVDRAIKGAANGIWKQVLTEISLPADCAYEGKVYPIKLFRIDGNVLPPYAQKTKEKKEKKEDLLYLRIFEPAKLLLKGTEREPLRDLYGVNRKKRKTLLRNLFGQTETSISLTKSWLKHVDDVDSQSKEAKDAYKEVFEQSEQAFLDFLSKASTDLRSLHSFPEVTTLEGTFDASVYFYSTKDICRYCRGTLAYLLSNDKLKKWLEGVLQEDSGFRLGKIDMYAFSFDQTDV